MKFSPSTCKTFLLSSDINSKLIYWKWLLYFSYYLATISGRLRKLDQIFSEHNFSRSTACMMCFEKHWMLNIFGGLWANFWVSWDIREAILNSFLTGHFLLNFELCVICCKTNMKHFSQTVFQIKSPLLTLMQRGRLFLF